MSDLPKEAVTAAEDAYRCAHTSGVPRHEIARIVAVAAVEAAAPAIAAHVRRQDEEERERTLVLDQDLAEEAEDNHGAPDLVERMAYAIPVRLVKSEAVGIGAARRECIARAVLPVVENELERARADERRKIVAQVREIVEDDGPIPLENWRAFKGRHKRLVTGDSVVAVLLAVADEIEAVPERTETDA